jgi:hypothetical protein
MRRTILLLLAGLMLFTAIGVDYLIVQYNKDTPTESAEKSLWGQRCKELGGEVVKSEAQPGTYMCIKYLGIGAWK